MGGHLVLPPQRKGQLRQRGGRRVDWDPGLREQQCKGAEARSHKDSLWLQCKGQGRGDPRHMPKRLVNHSLPGGRIVPRTEDCGGQ